MTQDRIAEIIKALEGITPFGKCVRHHYDNAKAGMVFHIYLGNFDDARNFLLKAIDMSDHVDGFDFEINDFLSHHCDLYAYINVEDR